VSVTRSVGDLIGDLRDRADIELMDVRHPDERLRVYLTQSLRACLNELVRAGYTEHLTWGAATALPIVAADGGDESYLEVDFPVPGCQIFGVDVHNTTRWYSLDKIQPEERRQYECRQGQRPAAYLVQRLPRTALTAAAALDDGIIQIYPASTLGLDYRLIYLAPHPELTKNSQLVAGFDGDWLEWAIWDAAIKVHFKDDEADPSQDAKAVRERAMVGARMGVNINRVSRGPILPTRAGTTSRRVHRG